MSVINSPIQNLSQLKAAVKNQLASQINQSFSQLKAQFATTFSLVWNNSLLTPQEVFDAFGTDAAELFKIADAIQTAVNTIQPGALIQAPPEPYTINEDGSVTVTNS